ncbi:PD-(D/E)XK nuclease family protein [Flavicella marina]|uniref:PD-(D/E)XK nuclease family protein n=1 Tax=Flavicella marina TaxID=1475951 RepID=UPI001263EFF0|nr:PD-(D/E)XK nuclease family protein [Flavicella marina]
MKTFLSEVVSEILKTNVALVDTTIVLPSERAGVFLKEALKKQIDTTTFLPKIISVETFIESVSKVQSIDAVSLLFEFYNIYVSTTNKEIEPFDNFSQWASVVLQDFNEVDRHLVDSESLFHYLSDIKRIENWNVGSIEDASDLVNNHIHFMEEIGLYYRQFYTYLLSKGKGYQGLQYREAVKNIDSFLNDNGDKKFVLVGFNALNKAEESIFQKMLDQGNSSIYWDSDAYYFNSNKVAGSFQRKYNTKWNYFQQNPFNLIQDNFSKPKTITEIAASKNVTQIKGVGELLSTLDSNENVALVLADESLLSLTLSSLPTNVDRLNITMGYLLKDMPVSGFFEVLFELYLNQQKLGKIQENKFYYKDVFRVLEHPYLAKLFSIEEISVLKKNLVQNNEVFVELTTIVTFTKNFTSSIELVTLFEMTQDVTLFIENCLRLIELQKNNLEGFEKECLYRFFNLFNQLKTLNGSYGHIKSIKTLKSIYKQLIATEKLSFQGEPLSGLQLMGMLETRVLDFETVIISSVNEGILPAGKNENSFIPFDVKREYGLPTYQEKDAIFSYHFYRLLQRAKNVYLFYNSETDEYGAGEKSRFITQLEVDGIPVQKKSIAPKVTTQTEVDIFIEKTPAVIDELKKIAKKGLSPSALAKYIEDPIRYYKRYVLKIKELEEVEETVAANTMGTIIHEVLENFYKPYIGQFLKVDDVKLMKSKIEKETIAAYRKHYKNGAILYGKNKLIFEVSKDFIQKFLNSELEILKNGSTLKILGTETDLETTLEIEGLNFPIKIRGSIDRIDKLDGVLRIIDYKTGKVEAGQLKVSEFDLIPTDYKYTKAMQVMLYAYLYTQNNSTNFDAEMESGIFSFKNRKAGFLKLNFAAKGKPDTNITKEKIEEFMEVIQELINEIFNQSLPFKENKDRPFQ